MLNENAQSTGSTQAIEWSVDSLIETALTILETDSPPRTTNTPPTPQSDLISLRDQIKNELRAEIQHEIDNARADLRAEIQAALESLKRDESVPQRAPIPMPSGW